MIDLQVGRVQVRLGVITGYHSITASHSIAALKTRAMFHFNPSTFNHGICFPADRRWDNMIILGVGISVWSI